MKDTREIVSLAVRMLIYATTRKDAQTGKVLLDPHTLVADLGEVEMLALTNLAHAMGQRNWWPTPREAAEIFSTAKDMLIFNPNAEYDEAIFGDGDRYCSNEFERKTAEPMPCQFKLTDKVTVGSLLQRLEELDAEDRSC